MTTDKTPQRRGRRQKAEVETTTKSVPDTPKKEVVAKTAPDCDGCGLPMQAFTNLPTAFFCNDPSGDTTVCPVGVVNTNKMANTLIEAN